MLDIPKEDGLQNVEDHLEYFWNAVFAPTLAEAIKYVHQANREKGWWEGKRNTGELLMLAVSELAEALEADRKDAMDDKLPNRKGLEVEIADCIIRLMDMAGGLNLDLAGALVEKLEYNKSRPYKHGKKY